MTVENASVHRIRIVFGAAILALIIVGSISYRAVVVSSESQRWLQHTHEVLENIQDVVIAVKSVELDYRSFVLTGNEIWLKSYSPRVLSAAQHVAAIRKLTTDNATQAGRMSALESVTLREAQFAEKVINLRRTAGSDAAENLIRSGNGDRIIAEFSRLAGDLQKEEERLLVIRQNDARRSTEHSKVILISMIILGLLIAISAAWNVQRDSSRLGFAERLLGQEQETTALLDLTYDAILVRNLNNEIVFWNKGAESLYGWKKSEVLGRTTHALLHTIFPSHLEKIESEITLGGYWEGELTHQRRDGTTVIVLSRWAVKKDDKGKPVAILESNRDISVRKEIEKDLAQLERRYRGLLEAAPDAMVIVDQNATIVLVNAQTEKLFGYNREELLGKPIEILIPHSFRASHPAHRNKYFEHPQVRAMGKGMVLFGLRQDGNQFPAEVMLSPSENGDGTLVTAAIRDITERKQVEEALRQSEERFRLMVSNVSDYAILLLDTEGNIVSWNEGAERIKGYKAEEIIGRHFSCFYSAEDVSAGKPADVLSEASRHDRFEDEGWRIKKDGSRFLANVVITALRNDTGNLRGFVKISRDITARRTSEDRLMLTMAELKRSNNELLQFANVASHDLQEPLRMVASYTQLLAKRYKGNIDADADEFIGYAVDGCNRMQRLIEDLLTYSRAGAHTKMLNEVSCEATLKEALSNLKMTILESGAVVTYDALPIVSTDGAQLVQVFQNLIGNAIKYRGPESPRVHISAVDVGDNSWEFSVKDNGLGIEPQYFERIFILFQRLHGRTEFEGTGIGLAICKKIVERLGGSIGVESEPGNGSRFFFSLPKGDVQ